MILIDLFVYVHNSLCTDFEKRNSVIYIYRSTTGRSNLVMKAHLVLQREMFGTSLACSVGISYVPQTDKCGRTRVHPKRNAT